MPKAKAQPVEVRIVQGNRAPDGSQWTVSEARAMVRNGYTPEKAHRVTGIPLPMLTGVPQKPGPA